jgi:hypothetical protein
VGYDGAAGEVCYWFTSDGFGSACGGLNVEDTAKELRNLNYLVPGEHGRLQTKRQIGSKRMRLYVVRASILEFDALSFRFGNDN